MRLRNQKELFPKSKVARDATRVQIRCDVHCKTRRQEEGKKRVLDNTDSGKSSKSSRQELGREGLIKEEERELEKS